MTVDVDTLARLAWVQLWQMTAVAILVAAVVRICGRARPRLDYALWMLVIVKAIVPPVWSSPTGLFSWALADTVAARIVVGDVRAMSIDSPTIEPPASVLPEVKRAAVRNPATYWPPFRLVAFYLWLTGVALGTAYVLAKALVAASMMRRSRLPVDERFHAALVKLSRRLGVKREIQLLVTSRPIGPAAFGLFRPSIVLPAHMLSAMRADQIELVLAHELVHIRRRDVVTSKLQLAAQLVWWFNPLVWWVNQQANRERERCCDVEVIAGVKCKPVLYARTLLNLLEQKERLRSLVALPGVRAVEVTSRRLEFIMKHAETDPRSAARFSRLLFAAGLLLLLPGMGITLHTRLEASDDGGPSSAAAAGPQLEQQMQGKWKIVRCEFSGRIERQPVGVNDTIVGNKWLRPDRRTSEYRLSFDTTKNPISVDLSADRLGEKTLKGIFSLDGDKMVICYAYDPDSPRPTGFNTTPAAPAYLYELKRVTNTGANSSTTDADKSSATGDNPHLQSIQGTWKIAHCEFSGRDEKHLLGVEDTISGNKWLRPKRRTDEYRLSFDATKNPQWVDLSADRLGERTLKGIYSLEGDKITICYAYDPDLARPTEFKTTPDAKGYLYVLERVKK